MILGGWVFLTSEVPLEHIPTCPTREADTFGVCVPTPLYSHFATALLTSFGVCVPIPLYSHISPLVHRPLLLGIQPRVG